MPRIFEFLPLTTLPTTVYFFSPSHCDLPNPTYFFCFVVLRSSHFMQHPYFSCFHCFVFFLRGEGWGSVRVPLLLFLPSFIKPQIPSFSFICMFSRWNSDHIKRTGRTYRRFFNKRRRNFTSRRSSYSTAWKY
jgi:hypothetical protein